MAKTGFAPKRLLATLAIPMLAVAGGCSTPLLGRQSEVDRAVAQAAADDAIPSAAQVGMATLAEQ